jgi:hypothetical protein
MIEVGYHCARDAAPRIRELIEERGSFMGRVKRKLKGGVDHGLGPDPLNAPKSPSD